MGQLCYQKPFGGGHEKVKFGSSIIMMHHAYSEIIIFSRLQKCTLLRSDTNVNIIEKEIYLTDK
jgi:hypothetical protein